MTAPARPLCIYHGNCADGFGAAWAVRKALGPDAVEFHAGVYQNPPPPVAGRDVIVVDFSYKRPVLERMWNEARSVLVLDHHRTAAEDLGDLPPAGVNYADWLERPDGQCVGVVFDMERSGAGITWDFFHDAVRPALIDHIEDRDLWRFSIDGTREIQAALFSYPYDFDVWERLMSFNTLRLREEGVAIERKHHKDVAELVEVVTRPMKIGGVVVPMANLPYTLTSDAGHLLCGQRDLEGKPQMVGDDSGLPSSHPFAGCYWDTPGGRVFSLRSRDDGADVGEIAKAYGGGGHKHASGFRVPFDQLTQFEP